VELLLERLLALGEGTHKGVAVLCHSHVSFIRLTARTTHTTHTTHTPPHTSNARSRFEKKLTLGETELLKLSDQHLVVDIVLGAVGDDEVQRSDEGLHIRIS
jgi:hypothetical protein